MVYHLPFRLVVEPPTRAELARLPRTRGFWVSLPAGVLLGAAAFFLGGIGRPAPAEAGVPLTVTSHPPGATVLVDGRARGRTPAVMLVAPGRHTVRLAREGLADGTRDVPVGPEGTALEVRLWRRQPTSLRLRPTLPGASIASARFTADGLVALAVALPGSEARQAWLLDPAHGVPRRVGPGDGRPALALAPDGRRFAFLAGATPATGFGPARLTRVHLGADGNDATPLRWQLTANAPPERLVELAWAPDGRTLLVVGRQEVAGGRARTTLRWLDRDGLAPPADPVVLPGEVLAGSYAWRADGGQVAFLSRAGTGPVALATLDRSGGVRYLADLAREGAAPAMAPAAWSPDGVRLAYAALPDEPSGGGFAWFAPARLATALHRLDLPEGRPERVTGGDGLAPAWLPDGRLAVLARAGRDGPLTLRLLRPSGAEELAVLPAGTAPSGAIAVQWDLERAQALVAARSPGLGVTPQDSYWLVRFGAAEDDR